MRISDWSSDVCSSDLEAWWPRLHSFAIGLEGSPDLAAARVAADALGTVHHGFTYTVEEGIDALPDVIRHIESFDVTTVRASTPMFLLARRIKAMGVKMVLSGEGSDEARSAEHTSELQSLMRLSSAGSGLKQKTKMKVQNK